MIGGLSLRYWAAKTLGEFYTRTLRIIEGHHIVSQGPCRFIRNPGYLGILMLNAGAGLAVMNWIVLLTSTLTGLVSFCLLIDTPADALQVFHTSLSYAGDCLGCGTRV